MTASPVAELTDDQIRALLNVGASFACMQIAADVLEKGGFAEEEIEAIGWLPMEIRAHTVARTIEAAEAIREELRSLDGVILALTGTEPAIPGSTEG